MSMKLAVALGPKIQERRPEVRERFRAGESHVGIARYLQGSGFGHIGSVSVLEHGVAYSLTGNDNRTLGPTYAGSIPRKEYGALVKQHREEAGRRTGLRMVKEGRGAHGLSHEELSAAAKKAALARGERLWDDRETWTILQLAKDKRFQNRGRPSHVKIEKHLKGTENPRTRYSIAGRLKCTTPETIERLERKYGTAPFV